MNCNLWRSHAESLLVARNFASGICKLKPKKPIRKIENLKPIFLYIYQPCTQHNAFSTTVLVNWCKLK